jgi:hypothetical protein
MLGYYIRNEWSLVMPNGDDCLDIEFFETDKSANVDIRDRIDVLTGREIDRPLQLDLIRTLFNVSQFWFERF